MPTRTLYFLYILSSFLFLSNQGLAQSNHDFSRLIFNRVLLDTETNTLSSFPENEQPNANNLNSSPTTLDIEQYQQTLFDLESTAGPFAEALAEQLGSLGKLYLINGEPDRATDTFSRARHIIRINHGLFTLQQVEFIEGLINSYDSQGDIPAIDEMKEYLFYIQQKNYTANDPAMIAAQTAWADWNIQFFQRLNSQTNPAAPLFNITKTITFEAHDRSDDPFSQSSSLMDQSFSSQDSFTVRPSIDTRKLVEPRLMLAQALYHSSLANSPNEANTDTLRKRLANITYIIKTQMTFLKNRVNPFTSTQLRNNPPIVTDGYFESLVYFKSNVDNLKAGSNTSPTEIAHALLELADWHLLFDYAELANPIYQEAYNILQNAGSAEAEINALFSPDYPLLLPTFSAQPYSQEIQGIHQLSQINYNGYIDISLTQSPQGNNTNIVYLQSSAGTPNNIRHSLLEYLMTQKSRPTFIDGQAVTQTDIRLRFYYSY